MTVLLGDTGKVAHGPLKTFTFTMATPREVSLGSSTLPSTEGATNQVSFTIQSSDLPTLSPAPLSFKYLACVIVSGKCGATSTTINYRIFKNGSSVITSNTPAHTANFYWTQSHWRWFDVSIGDVLDVRTWASVTDATIDYAALVVYPANVFLSKVNIILKDFLVSTPFALTLTGAGVRTTNPQTNNSIFITPSSVSTLNFQVSNVGCNLYALSPNPTVGTIRMNTGDASAAGSTGFSDATRINYQRNYVPTTISFREILR